MSCRYLLILLLANMMMSSVLAQTSWKGTTSTAWSTASNWTAGVPSATKDAILGDANFTGTYQPTVSKSATCKSLTIGGVKATTLTLSRALTVSGDLLLNSNGTISQKGTTLSVKGNWVNNGTYGFTSTSAIVTFSGTTQSLGGSNTTAFRKLTISAGSTTTLNRNISVASTFTVSGIFIPAENVTPYVVSGAGPMTVGASGQLKVNAATFNANYSLTGTITLSAGSVVEYAATSINQTIRETLTYSTLITSGGTTKTLAGNLNLLNGTTAATGNLNVTAGILDLSTFTANRSTTVAGGALSVANGATLRIGGTFPTGYTTVTLNPSSTVEYYAGGTQVVAAQTYGNLTFSSASGATVKTMPATPFTIAGMFTSLIGAGTADSFAARADITFNGGVNIGASTVFNGAGYTHRIAGNWTNNGKYVCRTDTTSAVLINGSGAVLGGTGINSFYNLTFAASNITGAAGLNLAVSGNLQTTGAGSFTQTTPGSLTMSGAGKSITAAASGTNYMLDNLTVTGSISTATGILLKGNLVVSGSFSNTTGVFTMNGSSKTITGAGSIGFATLSVPGSVTASSNFSVSSALDVSGASSSLTATAGTATFTGTTSFNGVANLYKVALNGTQLQLATSAVLGIADSFRIISGTVDAASFIPNTIRFNGASAQQVNAISYYNLQLSGAGAKTAPGALTVNGDIIIDAGTVFNGGAATHSVKNNWTNNGTFNAGTGTILLNGANNAAVTGATTFNILTVNKTSASNVVTLMNDVTVPVLNMQNGNVSTGANTLTITGSRTGSGLITGNIRRLHSFVSGTSYPFEGPNNTIAFNGASGISSVTVNVQPGSVSGFPFGGSMNRTYTIAIPSGTYTNASLRLHYEDEELNGNSETTMQLWSYNGSVWNAAGKTGNDVSNNFVYKDSLTAIAGKWTLSDDANVARWNGAVSSNWSDAGNWTSVQGAPSLPPAVTDIVQIGTNAFVNQPSVNTPVTVKSILLGSAQAVTLSINPGGALTTSGNIGGSWSANATHTINTNNQKLTVGGDLMLTDGVTGHVILLNTGADTTTITGSLIAGSGANISCVGASVLNIGGNFLFNTPGTFTKGNSTIRFTGSGSQSLPVIDYNNLAIAKSGGIAAINSGINIGGQLTVNSGELDINAPTVVTGNVNIAAGAILNGDGVVTSVGGNWNNNGTFISLSGSINFNGNTAQSISATTFNNIILNKPAGTTATLTGNIVVNGNITINSGILNLATYSGNRSTYGGSFTAADTGAAILQVGGANNFPANFGTYALAAKSTVTYNGTVAQYVAGVTYGNLNVNSTAADTLAGSLTVNGDLSIGAGSDLNAGSNTMVLYGNWNNSGTFTPATGTVTFQGSNKTINGNTTFNRVAVYGSYSVINSSNLRFRGSLRILTGGSFNAGTGQALVDGDLLNSGSLTSFGVTKFTGQVVQNISFLGALISNSAGEIYFDGNVAPVLISNSTPTYAKLFINNTAGVTASVGWNVLTSMQIAAGSSFNSGNATVHNISGSFVNNGSVIVNGSSTLNFNPTTPQSYQLRGTSFVNNGTVIFGGTAAVTVNGVPNVMNDVVIANTDGVTATGGWNISGDFVVRSNAVFNAGANSYTVAGDIESDGTLNGNTSTFTMTGNPANISGSPATTFYNYVVTGNVNVNSDFNVARNFTNNNAFYDTLGSVIFTDSMASVIGGTASPYTLAQFTIQKTNGGVATLAASPVGVLALDILGGTLNTGTNTITQVAGSGLLGIRDSARLVIEGTNTLPVFTTYELDTFSTVEYRGTTQALSATVPYGNLAITAGTKTAAAALTVLNDFSLTGGVFNAGGLTHTVGGDWTMTGGSFTSQGNIILNGTGDQAIGSAGAFNNLTINKSAGQLVQSGTNKVSGTLTFTDGTFSLGNFDLTIDTNATIAGGNDTNYVIATGNGALVQHILSSGSKVYPVGNATVYLPATVTLNAGSVRDNISVRLMNGVFTGGTAGTPITTGVVNNTWLITEAVAGGTNATVALRWPLSMEMPGFTRAAAKLAHYVGGTWDTGPTLAATGTNPYTITRSSGITSFSPFIVSGALQPLPLSWLGFSAKCEQSGHYLAWATGNEKDNNYFTIEVSLNGNEFTEAGRVYSYQATTPGAYSFLYQPTTSGTHYYRIRQTDINGQFTYSKTVALNACNDKGTSVRLLNNPAINEVKLSVNAAEALQATVQITDIQGKVLISRILQVQPGSSRHTIDLTGIAAGSYYLHFIRNTGERQVFELMIQ